MLYEVKPIISMYYNLYFSYLINKNLNIEDPFVYHSMCSINGNGKFDMCIPEFSGLIHSCMRNLRDGLPVNDKLGDLNPFPTTLFPLDEFVTK